MVVTTKKNGSIERAKSDVQVRKNPQQSRAKLKVAKILMGAKAILRRDGRKGLSARKLAKECGLSASSIYDYFPNIAAILYQLCEERLEQELTMFQEFEKQDLGQHSMTDIVDLLFEADLSLDWGGVVDIQLEEAFREDPKLKLLSDYHNNQKCELIVKGFKKRDTTMSDSKLNALARYLLELGELSYKLRITNKIEEGDFVLNLTSHLVKEAINYSRV